jgi:hypothetical protein
MNFLYRIYHLKHKALLKGRNQQKKLDEEIINKINLEHKKEILKLQNDSSKTLLDVREQEKRHYEPIIKELRNEISALHQKELDNKEYYMSIMQYGMVMEETGEQAADLFQRAKLKITEFMNYFKCAELSYGEAIQFIDKGKSKVEYAQNLIQKEKPKLLKGIK